MVRVLSWKKTGLLSYHIVHSSQEKDARKKCAETALNLSSLRAKQTKDYLCCQYFQTSDWATFGILSITAFTSFPSRFSTFIMYIVMIL